MYLLKNKKNYMFKRMSYLYNVGENMVPIKLLQNARTFLMG